MDMKNKNLRDMEVTTGSGKDVRDTDQLSGEAKDSLSGSNLLRQYETSGFDKGKLGGMPSGQ